MIELILGAVALFVVGLLIVVVAVVVMMLVRKRSRSSLVPVQVRKALNDDLDNAIAKRQVDQVKRDWLEADGWTLEQ